MFFLCIMATRTFSFRCGNKEQEMMHMTTHLSVASVSPRGETRRRCQRVPTILRYCSIWAGDPEQGSARNPAFS